VNFPIWRGIYMAPGVPADAVAFWTDTVKKMTASPEWKAELAKLGWEPAVKTGDEFKQFVKEERARYQALLKELGFLKA
jgi:putative tricarboxylic transport membrane protein